MLHLRLTNNADRAKAIDLASLLLKAGEVIVVPSESSYGLACDARNPKALEKLFALKGRDKNKPPLVIVAHEKQAAALARFSKEARNFYRRYARKVVSMRFDVKKEILPEWPYTSIVVRETHIPFLVAVSKKSKVPFTSSSANKSEQPAAYSYREFLKQFPDGKPQPAAFFDFGTLPKRPASTIIDLTTTPFSILRQGDFHLPTALS